MRDADENKKAVDRLQRKGFTILLGPDTRQIYNGYIARCLVAEKGGKEYVVSLAMGKITGFHHIENTKLAKW